MDAFGSQQDDQHNLVVVADYLRSQNINFHAVVYSSKEPFELIVND